MKLLYIKYISYFFGIVMMFVAVSVVLGVLPFETERVDASADTLNAMPVIVIDPGHGGEDGGAQGINGSMEKDLNLKVSSICAGILEIGGYPVKMTRNSDMLLYDMYDEREDYRGYKKTYDLKNRIRHAMEEEAGVFVSIHMNKFFQSKYSGLQVYFSPNHEDSAPLAQMIRNTVKANIQPENERDIKKATSAIYILNNIQIPAVLVECGFLSNEDEESKLMDDNYRRSIGAAIALSVGEWSVSK